MRGTMVLQEVRSGRDVFEGGGEESKTVVR